MFEEVSWLVPIVAPFFIGLLTGVIIKRALKLALAVLALILALAAFGYITMPSIQELLNAALKFLPKIQEELGPLINLLPYSSATFIIGLVIGLWKG